MLVPEHMINQDTHQMGLVTQGSLCLGSAGELEVSRSRGGRPLMLAGKGH